jgi:hypothetical protein
MTVVAGEETGRFQGGTVLCAAQFGRGVPPEKTPGDRAQTGKHEEDRPHLLPLFEQKPGERFPPEIVRQRLEKREGQPSAESFQQRRIELLGIEPEEQPTLCELARPGGGVAQVTREVAV